MNISNGSNSKFENFIYNTAISPYKIVKYTVSGIKDTIFLSKDFALNVPKIPSLIQLLSNIHYKYSKNLELSSETILNDIEKGQSLLASIRSDIFGIDINYTRKPDNLSILNACMKYHDNIMLRKLISTQLRTENTRLDFTSTNNEGDDALITATKSNYLYGMKAILHYPDTMLEQIRDRYFTFKDSDIMTKDVEKSIKNSVLKSTVSFNINHQNNNGKTALMYSAESSCDYKFNILFDAIKKYNLKIDPNLCDKNGYTLLHFAAKNKNENILKKVLALNIHFNLNSRDNQGNTPLMTANINKNFDSARILLDLKSNLDTKNNQGKNPIQLAQEFGFDFNPPDISPSEKFIERMEKSYSKFENKVLHYIPSKLKNFNLPDHMLDNKVKRVLTEVLENSSEKIGQFENLYSKIEEDINKQLERLSVKGEELLAMYKLYLNRNDLFIDSFENDTLEAQVLVYIVDINCQRRNDGKNSLMISVENKDSNEMEWILNHSEIGNEIDFGLSDNNNKTALMYAAKNDFVPAITAHFSTTKRYVDEFKQKFQTLDNGMSIIRKKSLRINAELTNVINSQDASGKTALMIAIENKNFSFANTLIENCIKNYIKIDFELKDKDGETALVKAIKSDSCKLAKLLLKNGANKNITLPNGKTFAEIVKGNQSNAHKNKIWKLPMRCGLNDRNKKWDKVYSKY